MKTARRTCILLGLAVLAGGAGFSATPGSQPDAATVDLLTAIPAADQGAMQTYIPALIQRTKEQWLRVIPADAKAPLLAPGRVQIEFVVHANGAVRDMNLVKPSGRVALDRAAWAGITGAGPYAAFPAGVQLKEMKLRFYFFYNEKAQTWDDTSQSDLGPVQKQ